MAAATSAATTPTDTAKGDDRAKGSPSGRLLLRMPAALHSELARAAERQGVSLNQFITSSLSARIGWSEDGNRAAPAVAPSEGRARLITAALVANAVVIGLTGIAAIAILVLAWRG